MRLKFAMTMFMVLVVAFVFAQDSTNKQQDPKMYLIETTDGVSLTGSLVKEDAEVVVLKTKSLGEVTIQKTKIKVMKELGKDSFVKGNYWFENPMPTRYLIGPSAFSLKKGEGYYQNLYLFAHSFNIGITDHISIGGGTEIASLIFGQQPPSMLFITPKIGFDITPYFSAGGGILYVNVGDNFTEASGMGHYGILYGLATVGTKNYNLTLALGWGAHNIPLYEYDTTGFPRTVRESGISELPFITISGMARVAKRFAFTTENWIFPVQQRRYDSNGGNVIYTEQEFLVSYGGRFMGEKIAVDFGFINNPDIANEIVIGIPYIAFTVKFGGERRSK
jgi:hypothetical protein